ncbi:MAG: DNA topoisomerase I [Methanobacteriota archaeon]|nr:MAG: DNA topoisomerase I [Euryarchaeota archaeon]
MDVFNVEIPKTLVSKDYILALAEKPTAAKRIAEAISEGKPKKNIVKVRAFGMKLYDIEVYSATYEGHYIIIIPALGHLFTLVQHGTGWTYPTYDYKWVPISIRKKPSKFSKHEKRQLATVGAIQALAKKANRLMVMTDYDQEGEVIGGITFTQLRPDVPLESILRMKFSSLTKTEIRNALKKTLNNGTSGINFGMYERGLMRHYLDWLWGINLSRALIISLKNAVGQYQTMSIGRVQGPTLAFVAKRMLEVETFVPTPYFKIEADVKINKTIYPLNVTPTQITTRTEAEAILEKNQSPSVEVMDLEKSQRTIPPPVPYNLSELQRDAYRYFKLTPRRTLNAAEQLYLNAAISYPRTSSQKYPPNTNHKEILKGLLRQKRFSSHKSEIQKLMDGKLVPTQGKKDDPAHPAIHPTGQTPSRLSGDTEKIYDLIVKRYFATFGKPAKIENTKAIFSAIDASFSLVGKRVISYGWWKLFEPYSNPDFSPLPPLKIGDVFPLSRIEVIQKFTNPPPLYNEASLLREMEKAEIGTKATRAETIQTLISRKYVEGSPLRITRLGQTVHDVLSDYSPQVLSVNLSRNIEKMGDRIEQTINGGLKNGASLTLKEAIFQGIEILHSILADLQQNELEIGEIIARELNQQNREALEIGECPNCGRGKLKIVSSRRSGKRFLGCSTYFDDGSCDVTYPLPQRGKIIPTNQYCQYCGLPLLKIMNGKRPWVFCPNISCKRNEIDRIAYEKRMAKRSQK